MQDNPFQQYEPHLSIVVEEVRSWYWVWPLPKKKRVLVLASLDIVDPRKGQILVADQSMRSIISSEIKNQIDLVNYTVVVN